MSFHQLRLIICLTNLLATKCSSLCYINFCAFSFPAVVGYSMPSTTILSHCLTNKKRAYSCLNCSSFSRAPPPPLTSNPSPFVTCTSIYSCSYIVYNLMQPILVCAGLTYMYSPAFIFLLHSHTSTRPHSLLVCQTTTREDITQMLISFDTFLNTVRPHPFTS